MLKEAQVESTRTSPVSTEEFERLLQQQNKVLAEIDARGGGLDPADNLPRDQLYERDGLH